MNLDPTTSNFNNLVLPITALINDANFRDINSFSFGQTVSIPSEVTPKLAHKIKVLRFLNPPQVFESCFYVYRQHEVIEGIKTNITSIFIHHDSVTEVIGMVHQLGQDEDSINFYDNVTKETYLKIAEIAQQKGIRNTVIFFNNNFFYLNTKHLTDDFFDDLSKKHNLTAWFAMAEYDSRISNIGHQIAYDAISELRIQFTDSKATNTQIAVIPSFKRDFGASNEALEKYIDIQNTLSFAQYDILTFEQKENDFKIKLQQFIRSKMKIQRVASELAIYLDEFYLENRHILQLNMAKRKQLLSAYLVYNKNDLSSLTLESLNRFIQRKNTENLIQQQKY